MVVVVHHLDAQLPFREVAAFDGLVQVLGGVPEVAGLTLAASSPVMLRTPSFGIQWYLTSFVSPDSFTHL